MQHGFRLAVFYTLDTRERIVHAWNSKDLNIQALCDLPKALDN